MTWERGQYDTNRYRIRRKKMIEHLGGQCECGSSEDLQIHHKDPNEKSFTLSDSNWTRPWEVILKELAKCELKCRECHKKVHATEHGKRAMYNRGCRCSLCREATRIYAAERRARKKSASTHS